MLEYEGDKEFTAAVREADIQIRIGMPIQEVLNSSAFFKSSEWAELNELVIISIEEPLRTTEIWIDWASKFPRVPWKSGKCWDLLSAYLKGAPVWIFGNTLSPVHQVFEHCKSLSNQANLKAFIGESRESIELKVKSGQILFTGEHLALIVEQGPKGEPVITRIDCVSWVKLGVVHSQPLYFIDHRLDLFPTGSMPSCVVISNDPIRKITLFGESISPELFDHSD